MKKCGYIYLIGVKWILIFDAGRKNVVESQEGWESLDTSQYG